MPCKTVKRVICCTKFFNTKLFKKSAWSIFSLCKKSVTFIPYFAGIGLCYRLFNSKVAFKFKVTPMVKRISRAKLEGTYKGKITLVICRSNCGSSATLLV